MSRRIALLNTFVDNYNMDETIDIINQSIKDGKKLNHVVVNAAKVVSLQKDLKLRQSINECDLINADGQAVVWASKILKKPLKERVAGIDIMEQLVRLAYEKKYKIFFFGAKENVVKQVVETYKDKYNSEIIAGYRNGYFDVSEESAIAEEISRSEADILFVAISSPTKENFLYNNRELLKQVSFTMGVGGSFDVVSGLVKRAPLWMQKSGLEWFYRFLQEPGRMWKRYLTTNSKFIYLVLRARFS
ncbi:MAG: WecB/TagA/CpsF family glycosyltransferase [Flavobacteriaceae bacterium]|nr:WecB/TagA/CpsF family glycosyltransferase [Flavobacteriaceae bacterium]